MVVCSSASSGSCSNVFYDTAGVELLMQAATVHPAYVQLLNSLAKECPKARFHPADQLKHLGRIVEKAMLDPGLLGMPLRVFDVVRGMVVCSDLHTVANVLTLFAKRKDITLVRGKERFINDPSDGGWRDYLLCFYFNDESLSHHGRGRTTSRRSLSVVSLNAPLLLCAWSAAACDS